MGKKAGNLYINPKKLDSIAKPRMKEMISFLNCMALNKCKDDNCEACDKKDLLIKSTTQITTMLCGGKSHHV
ncbi:unnamed protein product [Eruca vesicaria subsp. sativa]|uniref:Uncharacterized protein n=1 Tax=Eruca vesicaria subsp. sativa TaxID=29727 RepID=A0ABC8M8W2_ERUVS|nr:unnamed protein product [Eruca vesicaria subsp. sativa]